MTASNARYRFQHTAARRRLESRMSTPDPTSGFNTQPPEGGWIQYWQQKSREASVSTHSRPKAAGPTICAMSIWYCLFQHTAARRRLAPIAMVLDDGDGQFQHTAARRRLEAAAFGGGWSTQFQHTAARRRLEYQFFQLINKSKVSTHSRPKAAGRAKLPLRL